MSRQDGLWVWTETVSTNMPQLSKPQATGLASQRLSRESAISGDDRTDIAP